MPRIRPIPESLPKPLPEVPHVTMAINSGTKRGIIITLPAPPDCVCYTMVDSDGEWCGEGTIKLEHYNPESIKYLWGFLEHNCPQEDATSRAAAASQAGSPLRS